MTVAEATFAAVRDRDWTRFIGFVDPDAAREFKRQQRGLLMLAIRIGQARSRQSKRDTHESPRELMGHFPLLQLYNVQSLEAFDALADLDVVGKFMRAMHPVRQNGSSIGQSTRVLLGVVYENPDFAHVVFRATPQTNTEDSMHPDPFGLSLGAAQASVDVLTLRNTPEGWRSQLNGGLISSGNGGFSIGFNGQSDDDSIE